MSGASRLSSSSSLPGASSCSPCQHLVIASNLLHQEPSKMAGEREHGRIATREQPKHIDRDLEQVRSSCDLSEAALRQTACLGDTCTCCSRLSVIAHAAPSLIKAVISWLSTPDESRLVAVWASLAKKLGPEHKTSGTSTGMKRRAGTASSGNSVALAKASIARLYWSRE